VTDWKPLPGGLASDIRHLVAELRDLKDHAGLSLAVLGSRTPYSKSSWERYLNGKALPPQHAVTSLGKLADADPARLVALWELANTAWRDHSSGDTGGARDAGDVHDRLFEELSSVTERAPAAQAEEPPSGSRRFGRQLIRAVVTLAAVVGLFVSLYAAFGRHSGAHADRDGTVDKDAPTRQLDVNCFADSCSGKNPGQSGCGGDAWTAALYKVAGVYVELRYSDACKAAWSRISWGHPGDIARVVGEGGQTFQNKVHYDTDTFSAMVAAPSPSTAKACVLLTSGVHACTSPGGTQHLTEPPNPPTSATTSATAGPR